MNSSVDAPLALGDLGSLDEVEISGRLSDGFVDEDLNVEDIFDCYDGDGGSQSDPGWESSCSSSTQYRNRSSSSSSSDGDSDLLLRSEESEAEGLPRPAELLHDDDTQQGEGDDKLVVQAVVEAEELERGDDIIPVLDEPTLKKHDSKAMKTSRRKRRDKNNKKKRRSQEVNTGLGDAWSSRWLTGEQVLVHDILKCSRLRLSVAVSPTMTIGWPDEGLYATVSRVRGKPFHTLTNDVAHPKRGTVVRAVLIITLTHRQKLPEVKNQTQTIKKCVE